MDQVKFFKGCLRQILLGSFLDTLSHIIQISSEVSQISKIERLTKKVNSFHLFSQNAPT